MNIFVRSVKSHKIHGRYRQTYQEFRVPGFTAAEYYSYIIFMLKMQWFMSLLCFWSAFFKGVEFFLKTKNMHSQIKRHQNDDADKFIASAHTHKQTRAHTHTKGIACNWMHITCVLNNKHCHLFIKNSELGDTKTIYIIIWSFSPRRFIRAAACEMCLRDCALCAVWLKYAIKCMYCMNCMCKM